MADNPIIMASSFRNQENETVGTKDVGFSMWQVEKRQYVLQVIGLYIFLVKVAIRVGKDAPEQYSNQAGMPQILGVELNSWN